MSHMIDDPDERFWHALYVRSRMEKKVLSQLEESGYKAYLPLITQVKQWSDRKKKVEEPLFKSYVFAAGQTEPSAHLHPWTSAYQPER